MNPSCKIAAILRPQSGVGWNVLLVANHGAALNLAPYYVENWDEECSRFGSSSSLLIYRIDQRYLTT